MNNYLIPANTKKGLLILGIFRKFDLILFLTGVAITLLLIILMPFPSTGGIFLILLPALICGFLVMPVPYYHNMLVVITELYDYLTTNQKYEWKGWEYKDGKQKRK